MKKTGLIFASVLLTGAISAQELATTVKSSEVIPGIYLLEGADGFGGGNIALLVGDEHVLLIDDGVPTIGGNLLAETRKLAGRPVDFVVNTHVHGDHVGSNAVLADSGAIVFAHDNIRRRLLDKPEDAGGAGGLPVVTFADAVTFHVNGHEAHVFHVAAAHTDGDAVIEFRDVNVIHAGDLFFNGLFPFIDLDNGGSVEGFIEGQRRLLEIADEDTRIIPGHGPLADQTDLRAAVDMLVDARARVQRLVDAGMSQDEVLAENPLAAYADRWSWAFISTERMTTTLYRSLTGN